MAGASRFEPPCCPVGDMRSINLAHAAKATKIGRPTAAERISFLRQPDFAMLGPELKSMQDRHFDRI
jgi:hypothetical protein